MICEKVHNATKRETLSVHILYNELVKFSPSLKNPKIYYYKYDPWEIVN